jgi:hypothetical protein
MSVSIVYARLSFIVCFLSIALVSCAQKKVKPADGKEAFYGYMPVERIECEGEYKEHLQGICSDHKSFIFWSFTDVLVKTDMKGKVIKKVKVAYHHGDLYYLNGKIYVAVGFGIWNNAQGLADSWVYVYDAETLQELEKHRVPELVYGAGGITWNDGHFVLVGGLPEGFEENYLYIYDKNFRFVKSVTVKSGYSKLGIQTIDYFNGIYWLGCYGSFKTLLLDQDFAILDKHAFDLSFGIHGFSADKVLIGIHLKGVTDEKKNRGALMIYEKKV